MDPGLVAVLVAFIAATQVVMLALINKRVGDVHTEVKTGNGQTLGALADIAEGRAAQAIPVGDRTAKEQHHADMKTEADATGDAPSD